MKCPHCHQRLLYKSADAHKLRVPILVFNDDGDRCVTSCPKCKEEVELPVTLNKAELPQGPRLVIRNPGLTRPPKDP